MVRHFCTETFAPHKSQNENKKIKWKPMSSRLIYARLLINKCWLFSQIEKTIRKRCIGKLWFVLTVILSLLHDAPSHLRARVLEFRFSCRWGRTYVGLCWLWWNVSRMRLRWPFFFCSFIRSFVTNLARFKRVRYIKANDYQIIKIIKNWFRSKSKIVAVINKQYVLNRSAEYRLTDYYNRRR